MLIKNTFYRAPRIVSALECRKDLWCRKGLIISRLQSKLSLAKLTLKFWSTCKYHAKYMYTFSCKYYNRIMWHTNLCDCLSLTLHVKYITLHLRSFNKFCCMVDDCKYAQNRLFAQNKLDCSCPHRCTWVYRHTYAHTTHTHTHTLYGCQNFN